MLYTKIELQKFKQDLCDMASSASFDEFIKKWDNGQVEYDLYDDELSVAYRFNDDNNFITRYLKSHNLDKQQIDSSYVNNCGLNSLASFYEKITIKHIIKTKEI